MSQLNIKHGKNFRPQTIMFGIQNTPNDSSTNRLNTALKIKEVSLHSFENEQSKVKMQMSLWLGRRVSHS